MNENLRAIRSVMTKTAGGEDFSLYISNPDAAAAFRSAQDGARHSRGHEGYSGTIAEKPGYTIRSRLPMTRNEARAFVDKDLDNNDKWSDAFAIPICEESKPTIGKEVSIKVRARDNLAAQEAAKALVLTKITPGPKESVNVNTNRAVELKAGGAPKIGVEKLSEVYYRAGSHHTKHPDKRSALEAAKKMMSETYAKAGDSVLLFEEKIFARVVREADPARLPEWEVKVTVERSVKSDKIIGWMFYGIASS